MLTAIALVVIVGLLWYGSVWHFSRRAEENTMLGRDDPGITTLIWLLGPFLWLAIAWFWVSETGWPTAKAAVRRVWPL